MIKKLKIKISVFIILISFILFNTNQNASEILIYADDISYDQNGDIIAKGKAKILHQNNIISSKLIIYSQKMVISVFQLIFH